PNVPRDYVEFPSQLLERWLSTRPVLDQFALHFQTGQPVPAELVKKIERTETFNQGFKTVEYLASALVDMKLHLAKEPTADPRQFEKDTLAALGMPREIVMRHRTAQFHHIFADGYEAGYYSYLWSDTLSADAYEAFMEASGPYDKVVAKRLHDDVFSVGNTVFDPGSAPTDGMGITAELFWRRPGVLRSTHPGSSFAAEGPLAERICQPQPLSPPHGQDSPVGRLHHLGGQVLLLGVRHSESTTLHLAEAIARVPYTVSHPCVVEVNGVARTVMVRETDHCCAGFQLADEWLRARGLQREGKVGNADARLSEARDLVKVAVEHLVLNPLVFLC